MRNLVINKTGQIVRSTNTKNGSNVYYQNGNVIKLRSNPYPKN